MYLESKQGEILKNSAIKKHIKLMKNELMDIFSTSFMCHFFGVLVFGSNNFLPLHCEISISGFTKPALLYLKFFWMRVTFKTIFGNRVNHKIKNGAQKLYSENLLRSLSQLIILIDLWVSHADLNKHTYLWCCTFKEICRTALSFLLKTFYKKSRNPGCIQPRK